jgi:hypothetical protein
MNAFVMMTYTIEFNFEPPTGLRGTFRRRCYFFGAE